MERYFLIGYTAVKKETGSATYGSLTIKQEGFPNKKELKHQVEGSTNTREFATFSIYEFKTKSDYESFIAA